MLPGAIILPSTFNWGYLIGPLSELFAILLRVNKEKWHCPSEDIFRVNEVENIRRKQDHSPEKDFCSKQL